MIFWIASRDGYLSIRIKAKSATEAVQQAAEQKGYKSFDAMLHDLNYAWNQILIVNVDDQRVEDIQDEVFTDMEAKQKRSIWNAFRFLRQR